MYPGFWCNMKENKMVEPSLMVGNEVKSKERSSETVAIDIASLSQHVFPDSASTPRSPSSSLLMKSLSRKGIQVGEKKTPATTAGHQSTGGTGGNEKSTIHVNVSIDGEASGGMGHPATPTFSAGVKKRIGTSRRSAPWLDPKRVLFIFATLSSVGTLILLYFTLSIATTKGGDKTEW